MSHKIARFLAGLPGATERVWWRKEIVMDVAMLEATLKLHLREMCERLDQAAGIAKAAEACANSGNVTKPSRSRSMLSNWSMR